MDSKLLTKYLKHVPQFPNHLALMNKGKAKYGNTKTFFGATKNPLGIEVEVENYDGQLRRFAPIYWKSVEDGSLRNNGIEFVSCPLSGHNIDYGLAELDYILKSFEPSWSVRTSIHVHVNVSSMTVKQYITLIALYAFFEDVLFSFVDSKRKGNPYCYPITSLNPHDVGLAEELKYCSLNTGATARYGTIEFRHLEGTSDIQKIRRWVQVCSKLVGYVYANDPEKIITRIKNTHQYKEFLKDVLGITSALFNNADFSTCNTNRWWSIGFFGDNACAVSGD